MRGWVGLFVFVIVGTVFGHGQGAALQRETLSKQPGIFSVPLRTAAIGVAGSVLSVSHASSGPSQWLRRGCHLLKERPVENSQLTLESTEERVSGWFTGVRPCCVAPFAHGPPTSAVMPFHRLPDPRSSYFHCSTAASLSVPLLVWRRQTPRRPAHLPPTPVRAFPRASFDCAPSEKHAKDIEPRPPPERVEGQTTRTIHNVMEGDDQMRYVMSVMVLEIVLALGPSASLAEDCHGQGQYFRRPATPPPPQLQMPIPPGDVVSVGSEAPSTLQDRRSDNMGH